MRGWSGGGGGELCVLLVMAVGAWGGVSRCFGPVLAVRLAPSCVFGVCDVRDVLRSTGGAGCG